MFEKKFPTCTRMYLIGYKICEIKLSDLWLGYFFDYFLEDTVMAGVLAGECSYSESGVSSHSRNSHEKQDEGSRWYFGRKEIEENSPSRLDGIDLKKETYLRKSYCTFLQDLGMRLKV